MKNSIAKVGILVGLMTATAVSMAQGPGYPSSGWGPCSWVYTQLIGTYGDDHYGYTRFKVDYTQRGGLSMPCCRAVCPPDSNPAPQTYTETESRTITTTKTWSGKLSGILNFMWNILTGMPFEASGGGSSSTTTTSTSTKTGTVACGQKELAWDVTTTTESYEQNKEASSGKIEKRTSNVVSATTVAVTIVGTNQTFNPCTGLTGGDNCPKIMAIPCEVIPNPGNPGGG